MPLATLLERCKEYITPEVVQQKQQLALFIQAEMMTLALVDHAQSPPLITWCRHAEFQSVLQFQRELTQWLSELPTLQVPCRIILDPASYRLVALEPPDVASHELKDAVFWGVKDLVDIPLDDLILDTFAIPDHGAGGLRKLLYAVASSRSNTEALVNSCRSVGLQISSVEILELILPQAVYKQEHGLPQFALLHVGREIASLMLCKSSHIYVARSFPIKLGSEFPITMAQLESDTSIAESLENLVLEIQRSSDYFQSQLGLVSPQMLYVNPGMFDAALGNAIGEKLGMTWQPLGLNFADIDDSVTPEQCQQAFVACVAAGLVGVANAAKD